MRAEKWVDHGGGGPTGLEWMPRIISTSPLPFKIQNPKSKIPPMRIHLVTYATPRFRHRQLILGWSARVNRVVDTITHWTPEKLLAAGFEDRCKGIQLSERGSGFWAWKPFIIAAKLREVPDGDLVFYCDVGRLYPFKLLDQPITPYIQWMDEHEQDVMPGVYIPWDGATVVWTKREALIALEMDNLEILESAPIQASFSLWLSSNDGRKVAEHWLELSSQRALVSDDPGLSEHPEFRAHRHDQALLTLCCVAERIKGISLGGTNPQIDTRSPSQVSALAFGKVAGFRIRHGRMFRLLVWPCEMIEKLSRCLIKFGKPIHE